MTATKKLSKSPSKKTAAKANPKTVRAAEVATSVPAEPTPAPATKAAKKQAAPHAAPRKLSALDAAAKVLAETGEPMNTKQMIEAMASKGYWASPGGKTPHATLYAAILREIGTKGKEARFAKTSKGHFAVTTFSPTASVDPKPVNSTKSKKPKAAKSAKPGAEPTIPDGTPGPKSMSELFRL